MVARMAPHTAQQQLEIGRAVLMARENGARWKLLERVYGRGRKTLWLYAERVQRLRNRFTCAHETHLSGHETSIALSQ